MCPDHSKNKYALRTFEFVERVGRLDDYDLICQEVEQELAWYGLTHVTILKVPGPMDVPTDGMLLNTRPDEYIQHYVEENYFAKDPVILELAVESRQVVHIQA